jgi:hypothetical protein
MPDSNGPSLVLENRHTGERLVLRRVAKGSEVWLELNGSLPPHREGPPMHIHFAEDEEGSITSGSSDRRRRRRDRALSRHRRARVPGSLSRRANDCRYRQNVVDRSGGDGLSESYFRPSGNRRCPAPS